STRCSTCPPSARRRRRRARRSSPRWRDTCAAKRCTSGCSNDREFEDRRSAKASAERSRSPERLALLAFGAGRRTMRRLLLITLALFAVLASPSAQSLSPERLARIDKLFQLYVDENRIGGAVALVLQDGKPAYERAFGWRDKEARSRMTADAIFRIASQTKALTSTAILSLMEEGKIGLADPAGRFIPAFSKTTVAVQNGQDVQMVPARRPITIRDLLTHTAGISYATNQSDASQYETKG